MFVGHILGVYGFFASLCHGICSCLLFAWTALLCSCFAWLPRCFGVSQSSDFVSGAARVQRPGSGGCMGSGRGLFCPRIIFVLCCLRLGEASHPGPVDSSTWTCGIFQSLWPLLQRSTIFLVLRVIFCWALRLTSLVLVLLGCVRA